MNQFLLLIIISLIRHIKVAKNGIVNAPKRNEALHTFSDRSRKGRRVEEVQLNPPFWQKAIYIHCVYVPDGSGTLNGSRTG